MNYIGNGQHIDLDLCDLMTRRDLYPLTGQTGADEGSLTVETGAVVHARIRQTLVDVLFTARSSETFATQTPEGSRSIHARSTCHEQTCVP